MFYTKDNLLGRYFNGHFKGKCYSSILFFFLLFSSGINVLNFTSRYPQLIKIHVNLYFKKY